jgi:hypothetical protein
MLTSYSMGRSECARARAGVGWRLGEVGWRGQYELVTTDKSKERGEGLELGRSSRTGAARCEEEEARVSEAAELKQYLHIATVRKFLPPPPHPRRHDCHHAHTRRLSRSRSSWRGSPCSAGHACKGRAEACLEHGAHPVRMHWDSPRAQ